MTDSKTTTTGRLLRPDELAQALGTTTSAVRAMRVAGRIPVVWLSPQRPRYDLEEVVQALKANRNQGEVDGR